MASEQEPGWPGPGGPPPFGPHPGPGPGPFPHPEPCPEPVGPGIRDLLVQLDVFGDPHQAVARPVEAANLVRQAALAIRWLAHRDGPAWRD